MSAYTVVFDCAGDDVAFSFFFARRNFTPAMSRESAPQ